MRIHAQLLKLRFSRTLRELLAAQRSSLLPPSALQLQRIAVLQK